MKVFTALCLSLFTLVLHAADDDLTEAIIGTWKEEFYNNIGTDGRWVDAKCKVVVTKHSIVRFETSGKKTAYRWFSHPEMVKDIDAASFPNRGLSVKDVLCRGYYDDLNPLPKGVETNCFQFFFFSADRKAVYPKSRLAERPKSGPWFDGIQRWVKVSNDIPAEAKELEATLPPIKEAPAKTEAEAKPKQDEDNKPKAAADEKVKVDPRIANAPVYHLKDGRTIRAMTVMKAGDDIIIKDDAGKMTTVKNDDVDSIEKPK